MDKPNKCKNCQWYGRPYWSIINPCDSCPNENNYKTIITIDREPLFKKVLTEEEIKKAMTNKSIFEITLEEKDKEIERLKEIAHKMHLWIFLHSEDEQKVYDELGLTDEENAMLGYSGQFRIGGGDESE